MITKASIITVTYNCAGTIEDTIKSVLEQTYPDIEYIIVDGMSTDGTWEKICEYKDRINVLIHEPDNGLYYAMNKGIERATGDVIGIINGDDWYERDAVATAVRELKDDTDAVYGYIKCIKEDGGSLLSRKEQIDDIWYNMIPHPSIFVKKSVYSQFGSFNTNYKIAADYEMILRFYVNGARFKYVDHLFANFREGGLTTSRDLECAREVICISMRYIDKCTDKEKYIPRIEDRFLCAIFRQVFNKNKNEISKMIDEAFGGKGLNNLCIFGAGFWGEIVLNWLMENGINCNIVLDNAKDRIGEKLNGVDIVYPDTVKEGNWKVIIATIKGYRQVRAQLQEYRNPKLQILWVPELDSRLNDSLRFGERLIENGSSSR